MGFKDKGMGMCQAFVMFVLELSQKRQRIEARVGVKKWIEQIFFFFPFRSLEK